MLEINKFDRIIVANWKLNGNSSFLKDYYPKHSWSEKIETEYKKWLKKNKGKL